MEWPKTFNELAGIKNSTYKYHLHRDPKPADGLTLFLPGSFCNIDPIYVLVSSIDINQNKHHKCPCEVLWRYIRQNGENEIKWPNLFLTITNFGKSDFHRVCCKSFLQLIVKHTHTKFGSKIILLKKQPIPYFWTTTLPTGRWWVICFRYNERERMGKQCLYVILG